MKEGFILTPYYIVRTNKFSDDITNFSTTPQQRIDATIDGEAGTIFTKHTPQQLINFIKYDLQTETLKNQRGRAYGNIELFEQYILINENSFYYSKSDNILIVSASKDCFKKFIKDINNIKDPRIDLSCIDVNFHSIIHNQNSLGINSIWLGKIPDVNLSALALMGTQVQTSDNYKKMIAAGAVITNLSLIFDYKGVQQRIMITRDGGIVLYKPLAESDALPFIVDIYNMFINNK